MEARKRNTLVDLHRYPAERVELLDGEIANRPMARGEHALAQSRMAVELAPFDRRDGPGGWWILTEIGVAYEEHACPTHDLAGWRKERMPSRPSGFIDTPPDWVCEIVSPGHERKDTLYHFLILQRQRVPYYWIVWPEDRVLIAYRLDQGGVTMVATIQGQATSRIPPFDEVELDMAYLLGN